MVTIIDHRIQQLALVLIISQDIGPCWAPLLFLIYTWYCLLLDLDLGPEELQVVDAGRLDCHEQFDVCTKANALANTA